MNLSPLVLKISGNELSDEVYLNQFAQAIASLRQPCLVVHGGGKEITSFQQRLGIVPEFVDGVRVTDLESLTLVEMVLCGLINKRLVRVLCHAGVKVVGLSGVDFGLITAQKMHHVRDMGYTGEIVRVAPDRLVGLLSDGVVPVIAPICLGEGTNYNVNADHVAGAMASALNAERLIFISNVAGVLQENTLLPHLTQAQALALIDSGVISGGMIPKVQTALEALKNGVKQVMITHLQGLSTQTGTTFTSA